MSLRQKTKISEECTKISKLLLKVDKDYKQLRELADKNAPIFKAGIKLWVELAYAKERLEQFKSLYCDSSFNVTEVYVDSPSVNIGYTEKGTRVQFRFELPEAIARYMSEGIDIPLLLQINNSLAMSETSDLFYESLQEFKTEETLLRPRDAAKMLGVSYKTLWRWWKEKKIRAKRLPSGRLRYYQTDIEKSLSKE